MNQLGKIGVSFCAALLMLLSGCGGRYSALSSVRLASTPSDQIKVMTFNIRTRTIIDGPNHWNRRKKFVADIIANNNADIIGLQEAKNSQLEFIRSALPQYEAYAAGRKDGIRGGESCPVLYRKDRFTLTDAGTFWFSDTPLNAGSKDWGNLPPRICSWVHLVEKNTGTGMYVYNLHLDNLSQNSREKSVQLLTRKIAARTTGSPYIVMGDFNMEMDNPAMQYLNRIGHNKPLLKSADAWQASHPNRTIGTRHGFKGRMSGPQIDHIRLSATLKPLDARIDARHRNGRYPSDHFPVVAKVRLTSPLYSRGTPTAQYVPQEHENTVIQAGAILRSEDHEKSI